MTHTLEPMKKQHHPIFFYSHQRDWKYADAIDTGFTKIPFLPIDKPIEKSFSAQQPSLVIICDSSEEESGINRMKEVRMSSLELPIVLIVKNPSKVYLKAALTLKVSHFFEFPLENIMLQQCVRSILKPHKKWIWVEQFDKIFNRFKQLAQQFFSVVSPSITSDVLPLPIIEGPFPVKQPQPSGLHPYFHIPKTELIAEQPYDISVQFFGNLNIQVKERPTPRIKGRKKTTILAYLLFHHDQFTHREILMEKFWSDISPTHAKNSLNVAICQLRKELTTTFSSQDIILSNQQSYGINPEIKVVTDTEKFIFHWKEGNAIEGSKGLQPAIASYNHAIGYYKGEFLSNLRFENWCEYERDNLKETYLHILNKLGSHYLGQQEYDSCIKIGKKMLKEDICLEEVHRKLMTSYYLLGLPDMANSQYFKCKKALDRELNLAPSEPTLELFRKIQRGKVIL